MNPFMLAVEKSHMEVMKVKEDLTLCHSLPVGSELTVIHRALGKDNHSAFFKVWSVFINSMKFHFPTLLIPFSM